MIDAIPDPEIFVGIAALGLTLTGFSGLISVLGRRSSGHWTEAERFQLGELIVISLAVTFASFVPVLVGLLQSQESALTTALFLVATFHLLVLVRGSYKNYQGSESAPKMPNGVGAVVIIGGLLLIGAAFLASFKFIGGSAFLLIANLLWQLLVGAIHFVLLLMNTGATGSEK